MKSLLVRLFFLVFSSFILFPVCHAQQTKKAQLELELENKIKNGNYLQDTSYFRTLNLLAYLYIDGNPDSALLILKNAADLCEAIGDFQGQMDAYNTMGNAYQTKGNFDSALLFYNKAYAVADKNKEKKSVPGILGNIALVYLNQGNYSVALEKFYASLAAAEADGNQVIIRNTFNNIGEIYFNQGKLDDAEKAYSKTILISQQLGDTANVILAYNNIGEVNIAEKALDKALSNLTIAHNLLGKTNIPYLLVAVNNSLGDCYFQMDSISKATALFETSLDVSKKTDNARGMCKALIGLAKVNAKLGQNKIALQYGLDAVQKAKEMGQVQLQRDAVAVVSQIYEQSGDGMDALQYYKEFKKYSDSLVNIGNEQTAASLKADYELSKKEQEFQRKTQQQRWMIFSALAALATTLLIIFIFYRNKKRLDQTYLELQQKNIVIQGQKLVAEETLGKLKSTQSQLIQAEKMASLGELVAGIAHEIQNPLNFVNNFSELNKELLLELKDEVGKGNIEEVKTLAEDVIGNEEKITQHGKRADAIVKGMLQHSRSNPGQKEPTELNALCEEYLRLSYHGLRAKDKSFNATLKTDYDATIGKIEIVPQDLGRVILNLLTNAFYAVSERQKKLQIEGDTSFKPTVSISTKKTDNRFEITVTDNGNGISKKALEKIFQPFFTTKPSGQGTGLGLSLSYDIVKAHGGEINVESKEGEGTEFCISLPIK